MASGHDFGDPALSFRCFLSHPRQITRRLLATAAALAVGLFAAPGFAEEKLVVWWVKGFYEAQEAALLAAIAKFEAKTGKKVELTQLAAQEAIPRIQAALDAGSPPDIAYADSFDRQAAGRWAFEGKLDDISDIIAPIKDRFASNTVETTYLLNGATGKRAYYAFPLKQQMLHVAYWKDMLATAGFKENDIPDAWKDYWAFWCTKVQPAFRAATSKAVYGVGNPMGLNSADATRSFYAWLDAYDVRLVDAAGKVLVGDPKVRVGLIEALRDYTDIYLTGCSPPQSIDWADRDNNRAFHDRVVILTHNPSLAIARKWLDEADDASLPAAQRTLGRRAYDELIATARFPRKPDGSPMISRVEVKVGVIFREARNKARAREFLKFLLEDDSLRLYVESARGRWFPVTKEGQKSAFWEADRHRKAVYDQFMAGTRPFEYTSNFKFAILDNENVWSRAMHRVVKGKLPVDKAVDELIERIRQATN
jgi:multiple sugar transport system substrate-binding protein